jgi:hypothetical protein
VNSVIKLARAKFLLLTFWDFDITWSSALPRNAAKANSKENDRHKPLGVSSGAQLANGVILSTTTYSLSHCVGNRKLRILHAAFDVGAAIVLIKRRIS